MCVMKMKKLTTFVACAAMAGVFATSAFAANDAQVARAQDYLNSKGIAYRLPLLMLTRLLLLATLPTAWLPRQTSCWTVQSLIPKVQRTRLSAS